jgi:hypothetical protein
MDEFWSKRGHETQNLEPRDRNLVSNSKQTLIILNPNPKHQESLSKVLIVNDDLLSRAYNVKVPSRLPTAPQAVANVLTSPPRLRGARYGQFAKIKARPRTAPIKKR